MTYEYAVQMRWIGESDDDWTQIERLYEMSLVSARRERDRLSRCYPNAEMRIVRRPVIGWEVVE